jgi:hypothetical protein
VRAGAWIARAAAAFLLVIQTRGILPDNIPNRWAALLRSTTVALAPRRAAGSGASLDRNFDLFMAHVRANTPEHAVILLVISPDPNRRASLAWYWHRSNFLAAPRLVYPEEVLRQNPARVDYVALYGGGELPAGVPSVRPIPGGLLGRAP